MHVALGVIFLVDEAGGAGTYARELVGGLSGAGVQVTAFVGSTAPAEVFEIPGAEWVRLSAPGVSGRRHYWDELAGIGLQARRRGADLVHGLAGTVPLVPRSLPSVVTLLDTLWLDQPATYPLRVRMASRLLFPLCARRATRVLTISADARERIVEAVGLEPAKIDVTPLGFSPPRAVVAAQLPVVLDERPVVLCVSGKRRYKNQAALVEAMVEVPGAQLVLAGSAGPYELELRALAQRLGVDVRFVGWVGAGELEALYARADVFVLPSLQEGFGLPVLEAMGRGVPVACSNTSSLPEVAGDAALLFDPRSPAQIAQAIRRVLGDGALAARLREAGLARVEQFSWERTARLTIESYERALCTSD
jgi:glycosyltransferase involved in cell wall biosynthesis